MDLLKKKEKKKKKKRNSICKEGQVKKGKTKPQFT